MNEIYPTHCLNDCCWHEQQQLDVVELFLVQSLKNLASATERRIRNQDYLHTRWCYWWLCLKKSRLSPFVASNPISWSANVDLPVPEKRSHSRCTAGSHNRCTAGSKLNFSAAKCNNSGGVSQSSLSLPRFAKLQGTSILSILQTSIFENM